MKHRQSQMLRTIFLLSLLALAWLTAGWPMPVQAAGKQLVYDHAGLLSSGEIDALEARAAKLGAKRETDFIIITLNGTGGKDIVDYVADFYDEMAPGFDRPHGNTAILAIDLEERDVFLAGFKKAETYLDDKRLDMIRTRITPALSAGDYYGAFLKYVDLSHEYMGIRPGANPENLLFKTWFQLAVSFGVAAIAVGVMAYHSGGRVTVNAHTYLDGTRSGIISKTDRFINKTVSRKKIERSSSGGGGGGFGGGGGGVTRGGHTFSGSRGKF